MKKTQTAFILAFGLLALFATGIFWVLRSPDHPPEYQSFNPDFNEIISAYTFGKIPRTAAIHVQFTENQVSEEAVGETLEATPFVFSPKISGKAQWSDTRTISFVPDEPLPSGAVFHADLEWEAANLVVPGTSKTFKFQFNTRPQSLDVAVTASRTRRKESGAFQEVSGIVRTVDFEPNERIEEVFRAQSGTKTLDIQWDHDAEKQTHTFRIADLERKEKSYNLNLFWNWY